MRLLSHPALALVALLAPTALAWGNAIIHNNCGFDLYVWAVGGGVLGPAKISSGSDFAQQFYFDHGSGGVSLKVCESANGLFTGAPQTIFAYTLDQGSGIVWLVLLFLVAYEMNTVGVFDDSCDVLTETSTRYDLSDVYGDAFAGRRVALQPVDNGCESIVWSNGASPGGTQTHPCK